MTREDPGFENKPGLVRGITAKAHRPKATASSDDAPI
jgi:hypothetical protein